MVAFALGVLACGGGGGGGGGTGGEPTLTPVTLASLPEADRQAFEAWKLRPLKSCTWYEAFPSLARTYPDQSGGAYTTLEPKIDVARFVEQLEKDSSGLPILQGAAGELVMFDEAHAATSFETCDRSSKREVNGVGTSFEAKSHRDDGQCVISLGGEEVFRGFLADHVPAALGYDPTTPASDAVKLGEVGQKPAGSAPLVIGRLDPAPLLAGALAALAPAEKTLTFLAGHFGITTDQARTLFAPSTVNTFGPGSAALTSMSVTGASTVDLSQTTPFAPGQYVFDAAPVQAASALQALGTPGTAQLALLYLPRLGSTTKLVRLTAAVEITTQGQAPYARLSAIHLSGGTERSDGAAVSCFLERYASSTPFLLDPSTYPTRSHASVYDGCGVLSPDGAGALASDPSAIAIVMQEVGGTSHPVNGFRGWDGALVNLVDAMLTRGTALTQLDPGGKYAISSRTGRLSAYLDAVADAETRRALQRQLVKLTFDQHFNSRVLGAAQDAAVVAALEKASGHFRDSTSGMLDDLIASDRTDGLAAAQCGADLTEQRIAAIEAAIADAQRYAYGSAFGVRLRGAALQACYSQADLDRVAAAVAAARAFTAAEVALTPGYSFEYNHQRYVDHALDERWSKTEYANAAEAIAFALVSNSTRCADRATISDQAACTDGLSLGYPWLSAAPGKALDPSFAGRYAVLARDLAKRFTEQLSETNDYSARYAIQSAYFGSDGMWLACGGEAYAAKRTALFGLLDRLRSVTDDSDHYALERQVGDLVASTCTVP